MRAFLLASLLQVGCSAGTTGSLALSWQFVDGRRCADTGAATVDVRTDDHPTPAASFPCENGFAPAAVTVDDLATDGVVLHVEARSPDDGLLYEGDLSLDALPASATVVLDAAQMR